MLSLTSEYRYLLRKSPTDMRKGFDSLCGLVRDELGRDPLSGEVFVFIGARQRPLAEPDVRHRQAAVEHVDAEEIHAALALLEPDAEGGDVTGARGY